MRSKAKAVDDLIAELRAAQGKTKTTGKDERWLGVFLLGLEFAGAFLLTRMSAWTLRRRLACLGHEIDKRQARALVAILGSVAWYAGFSWEGGKGHNIDSRKRVGEAVAMVLDKDDATATTTMKRTVVTEPE